MLERLIDTSRKYIRECYSLKYYWKFYLFVFCFWVGILKGFNYFQVFYGNQMTGGHLGEFGTIVTIYTGLMMGVFFVIGPLIDWLHPIRVAMGGFLSLLAMAVAGIFFIHGFWTYAVFVIATYGLIAVVQAAYLALLPRILPREQYGQFCSATAVLWHAGAMVLIPVCGLLIDRFGNWVIFAWLTGSTAIGLLALIMLYQDWTKLGGDEHYEPPTPWLPAQSEIDEPQ